MKKGIEGNDWKDDLLALLESHHARIASLERDAADKALLDVQLHRRVATLEGNALDAEVDALIPEKTFTREEARALMIATLEYWYRGTRVSMGEAADAVLREASR